MRSSFAALFHRVTIPLFALMLALGCMIATPTAFADEGEDDVNAIAPLASELARSRTIMVPASAMMDASAATITSGVVELASAESAEAPASTVRTTYVVRGCVYTFDAEAGEFTLVNAANAELSDDGYLIVPSALVLDDVLYPVATIAAGALSACDAPLVAFPSSVSFIDPNALAGSERLQVIYVSPNNEAYASFDGCLYDKPLSCLLLIPEGRLGAVRIASGAEVDPDEFSHCLAVSSISVDADSAASFALEDVEFRNAQDDLIEVVVETEEEGVMSAENALGEDASEEEEATAALLSFAIETEKLDGETVAIVEAEPVESVESVGKEESAPIIFSSVVPLGAGDTIAFSGDLAHGVWSAGVGSALTDVTTSSDARWELTGSVLRIYCKEGRVISGAFGSETAVPWYGVRNLVTSVVMEEGLQTDSMAYWFCSMTSLTDLGSAFIPEGCTDVKHLLSSSAVASVPASFLLPASVKNVSGMFESCVNLTGLPDGFTFANATGAGVPGADCANVFSGCVKLESLPEGFSLPGGLSLASAFERCWSLSSLPASMNPVPASATNVTRMFYDMSSLRILPAGFDFPAGAVGASSAEFLGLPAERDAVSIYCTSPSANLQNWFSSYSSTARRSLTTDATSAAYMQFMVPDTTKDPSDPSYWKVWKTVAADGDGMIADPGFEFVDSYAFSGWYINSDFRLPFDFSLPYDDQPSTPVVTTVYAKYVGPILDCIVPVLTTLSIDVVKVLTENEALSDDADILRFYTYNKTPVKVSAVTTDSSATALSAARRLFPSGDDCKNKVFLDLIVDGGSTIELPLVSQTGAAPRSIANGTLDTEFSPICKELEATVRLRTVGKPDIATTTLLHHNVASLIWTIEVDA